METLEAISHWCSGLGTNTIVGWVLIVGGWATFIVLFIDGGKED